MHQVRNVTNRIALACAGVALLAAGLFLLSAGSAVRSRLPAWWPLPGADTALVDRPGLERLREHGWWTAAVLSGLTVLLLLLLWWLAGQLRGGGRRPIPLTPRGISLRTGALAQAMATRSAQLPGVARANVRLRHGPRRLRATVDVVLEPDAEPGAVLHRLSAETLAQARESAAPRSVDAAVRMRVRAHRERRTR